MADTIGGAGDMCPLLYGNDSCRHRKNIFLASFFENGDGLLLFPNHPTGTVGVRLLLTDTQHYLVPIHQPGTTLGDGTLFFRANSPEVNRASQVFLLAATTQGQPGGGPEFVFPDGSKVHPGGEPKGLDGCLNEALASPKRTSRSSSPLHGSTWSHVVCGPSTKIGRAHV
mgnify:FL=1